MITVLGEGPIPSRLMIIAEAPGSDDQRLNTPLVGAGGQELNRMLHEAGLMRSEAYCTYLYKNKKSTIAQIRAEELPHFVPFRNKQVSPEFLADFQRLEHEIAQVQPKVIIALGEDALWALTGASGIMKWRGSQLSFGDAGVLPTYHPIAVLRQWENRVVVVADLRRAKKMLIGAAPHPIWNFTVRPSFGKVLDTLLALKNSLDLAPMWLDFDLETRAGHIACAGISWTAADAICIPFMCVENKEGYWSANEEAYVIEALDEVLRHPNAKVRGQNLLFDCQYTYRHWHFTPRVFQDTMITHHVAFSGMRKSLAFQASLYCDHYVYWKDDGRTWTKDIGEEALWAYNCQDCVRTREVGEVSAAMIASLGLQEVEAFQQKLFWPALQAMQRGVRIDLNLRNQMGLTLHDEIILREEYFKGVLGHPLNPASPKQMQGLFYEDLKLPIQYNRKAGKSSPTLDDKALTKLAAIEPLVRHLLKAIAEYRSLGVFLSTFVGAGLDVDNRMRCSFNLCGTETFRLSSSKNAFDTGMNMQNIPKGIVAREPEDLDLPNIRRLFIPDPGFTFFDMDLSRADLYVVVWESGDEELKAALRMGVDMHILNAINLKGHSLPDLTWLVEGHAEYERLAKQYKLARQLAKSFIHGTNYGGGAKTMSIAAGITVREAEKFQATYFGKYPGIKAWHERTKAQLQTKHFVTNAFGYRRYYFDRVDGLLPEALAWVPQSTVACVINRAWVNIYKNLPAVQVLIQVHDSLAGQIPT